MPTRELGSGFDRGCPKSGNVGLTVVEQATGNERKVKGHAVLVCQEAEATAGSVSRGAVVRADRDPDRRDHDRHPPVRLRDPGVPHPEEAGRASGRQESSEIAAAAEAAWCSSHSGGSYAGRSSTAQVFTTAWSRVRPRG